MIGRKMGLFVLLLAASFALGACGSASYAPADERLFRDNGD